jgi:hypothetical protein
MKELVYLVLIACWVFGVALAKGFWMTALCIFVPVVSWVVVAQWILEMFGK